MTQVTARLPDGTEIEISHREIRWFLKEIFAWREQHRGETAGNKQILFQAEKRLKELGVPFVGIPEHRRNNFMAKGFALLEDSEVDFLTKALQHVWLPGVPMEDVQSFSDAARRVARPRRSARIPTDTGQTVFLYARVLGLSTEPGSQEGLVPLEGEYLIFRRIFDLDKLVVSHMHVAVDERACFPAGFVTSSQSAGTTAEGNKVEGIMYQPTERKDVIYTIGKLRGTTQIRSTILQPVDKPVRAPRDVQDLKGIRRGLGRQSREPRGYRIWCSRLTSKSPVGEWEEFAREYSLIDGCPLKLSDWPDFTERYGSAPQDFFTRHIDGFQYILDWLNNPLYAVLTYKGDPTLL
jgi:hypothetical protein